MEQGREATAAAQEKLKPDEPEMKREEIKQSVDADRNRADSDTDRDVHIGQREELARLINREEQHAQDSDSVPDTNNRSGLSDVESADRGVITTPESLPAAPGSTIDSTVSNCSVSTRQKTTQKSPETVLSQVTCDTATKTGCDSTVAKPLAKVVSLLEVKKKKACDSTVAKGKKRGVAKTEPAPKPKAIKGHEWRRQGTGWTLLRSWYDRDETGARVRRREYVQHYSATALRRAETLRRKML